MLNIGEEKEHIYRLMREVTEERRKLTEIYYELKSRLDDLSKLEIRGLDEISIKGYVDMHNKFNKNTVIANLERETKAMKDEIEKPKEEEIVPKKDVEIQKEKDAKRKYSKRSPQVNIDKVIGEISSILKESGVPMRVGEIHEKLNERMDSEVRLDNFRNNIMPRTTKKNKRIQRASFGYYQYTGL